MTKNIFIVSKPLQFVIATILREQLNAANNFFFVIDNIGWSHFIKKRRNDYCECVFFDNHKAAYKHLNRYDNYDLYIDSDVGFYKYVQLAITKLFSNAENIFVYEEGIGSYRNNLYSGFKRKIFEILKVGVYFGGSYFVSGIYVCDPAKYINSTKSKKAVMVLNKTPYDFFVERAEDLISDYNLSGLIGNLRNMKGDECTLYLGGWDFDREAMEVLAESPAPRLFKPHPHCGSKNDFNHFSYCDILIDYSIPAELLLCILSGMYKNIKVLHHGTSAEWYVRCNNVHFEKLKENIRFKF